jgi:hypothetical protein
MSTSEQNALCPSIFQDAYALSHLAQSNRAAKARFVTEFAVAYAALWMAAELAIIATRR